MLLATIITHFSIDDPNMEDDYTSVSVHAPNMPAVTYGNAEEKGKARAEGFADALRLVFPNMVIRRREVADGPSSVW